MRNRSDQFAKNVLRDALSRASTTETEVEVLAATQKIDVYCVPDPARKDEREQMGLLGELSADPSLFEPFRNTPNLPRIRRCLCKQLTWHHELERRATAAAPSPSEDMASKVSPPTVPFPILVVIGPGRPETVLDAYGCKPQRPGIYQAVWGVAMRVVVLAELPRTRDTLMLRLLGKGALLREALVGLAALPDDAWEKGVALPLLVHFKLASDHLPTNDEDDVSAEIQAWFQDFQQKARNEGERVFLLRLLRTRFGELPAAAVARVEVADGPTLEHWGERVLTAQTLDDVLDAPC